MDYSNPDFLIIGTQKGGTASLFDYLFDHHKLTEFLNIPYIKVKKYRNINKGSDSKYKGLNKNTRRFLAEYFEPYNQELYKFLNRDLNWYKEAIR